MQTNPIAACTLALALAFPAAGAAQERPDPQLAKGLALEAAEHDLEAAADVYAALAADERAEPAVRTEAWLRLARVLVRQGRADEARRAFERAAAGGGDAGEEAARQLAAIQDPARSGGTAVDAEIDRLLETLRQRQGQPVRLTELLWYGERALPKLFDAVQSADELGFVTACASAALTIGGPSVDAWLAETLTDLDPLRRRAVARAANVIPAERRTLLEPLLRDPDAEVRLEAIASGVLTKLEQAIGGLADEDARVRRAVAAEVAGSQWRAPTDLPAPERQREVVVTLIDRLDRVLSDRGGPALRVSLFQHLLPALTDPAAGAAALLRLARSRYFDRQAGQVGTIPLVTPAGENVLVEEALVTARALQDVVPFGAENWRLEQCRRALSIVSPTWDRTAADAVFELLELGFPLPAWFLDHAGPADYPRVFANLDRFGDPSRGEILFHSQGLELPDDAFVPLRERFEEWLGSSEGNGPPIAVLRPAAARLAMFDGAEAIGWGERVLVEGFSAPPEVRTKLELERDRLRDSVFQGLVAEDSEARRAALRRLAVARGEGLGSLRNQAIAWLAFLHDEGVVPLVAQAYELGLSQDRAVVPGEAKLRNGVGRGLTWFLEPLVFEQPFGTLRRGAPWEEAALAAVVEPCLRTGRPEPWEDLGSNPLVRHSRPVLEAILRQFDRCPDPKLREKMLSQAATYASVSSVEVLELRPAFALRGLADPEYRVAHAGAALLAREDLADDGVREAVVRAIGADGPGAAAAIERVGKFGDATFWDAIAARVDDPEVDTTALGALSAIDAERAVDSILAWARRHPDFREHWIAVQARLSLDPRFVPFLLDALRNPLPEVQASARDALEAIEFYVTKTRHWERLRDGAGLDATSAAEALLEQAREAPAPRIRIAAIESLGTLAAPETLPFLIELMQDDDDAIAAAAAAAVQRINAGK